MEHTRFGELHALLKLARQLRASAAETTDITYVRLFLKAAGALEARADRLAFPQHSLPGRQARAEGGVRQGGDAIRHPEHRPDKSAA